MLNCRNYGDITSESISASQKRGVAVNIGGVAGGDYNKVEKKPSVSWCINYGKIAYVGDSPTVNVAGVIGMSEKKVPLKYCVNRGEVIVTAQSDAGDPKIHSCNVSGVCANTSGNVVDCDNYGRIVAGGTFATVVGGVVGLEGSASVITGCLNYGYVSSTSAATSNLGGVIGFSRSAVHISNCQNHGEVLYAGLSPNAPSSVGGVTGQIYSSGKAKKTAYIRDCVNYGKISTPRGIGIGGLVITHENFLSITPSKQSLSITSAITLFNRIFSFDNANALGLISSITTSFLVIYDA